MIACPCDARVFVNLVQFAVACRRCTRAGTESRPHVHAVGSIDMRMIVARAYAAILQLSIDTLPSI